MKSLLIFSNKRKSGKMALACSIADAAACIGEKAAIIDAHPRRDASYWAKMYKEQMDRDLVVEPGYISCVPQYLKRMAIESVQPDWILISARASEKFDLAVTAARAVNMVLIPYYPTPFDLQSIKSSIRVASEAETPALVILNAIPGRTSWEKDAENYLSTLLKSHPAVEKTSIKLEKHESFIRLLTQRKYLKKSDDGSKRKEVPQEIVDLYKHIDQQLISSR